ncbi:LIC11966 family surface protein [Chryseolinea lacunae]|uniref:Uncharacterized protein n=1 Tax=Chryseolinea lacunae TaxID=2801331 RepID=A0ABS1KUL2_9BACT|nr:hypothetical protein [Chryseolinea lacunae]MBL0743126.1 hypothetical protein [Chryseolinea lacunae]
MNLLSEQEETLSLKYLSYMSEVAHGGSARKMEKRRQDLLAAVRTAIREGGKVKPFEGDVSLRNAYVGYWNVLLSVLNEDYHKIIDMEEVAERSYDAMEAYLLMQEKADEKLNEAYLKVPAAYQAFAAKHNVQLSEGQSTKLTRKLNQTGKVNTYLHQLFLIYFKSTVQESNMIEALNKKDINGMEQNKNAMKSYAEEGLAKLDTLKPFKGDGSVITACRKVLEFQKNEATKISALSDFTLKNDEFEKMKKAFDAKPANSRTAAEVDTYNKSIATFNKSVQDYNKVNNELNTGRNKVLNNWETSRKRFMDLHVPHK